MMFSLLNVLVGVNLLKRPAAQSLAGSGKSTKPRLFWLRKISIGQAPPTCLHRMGVPPQQLMWQGLPNENFFFTFNFKLKFDGS